MQYMEQAGLWEFDSIEEMQAFFLENGGPETLMSNVTRLTWTEEDLNEEIERRIRARENTQTILPLFS